MSLFPREMFTDLNTGICTKGYASFRDNAKVSEPSLCCSVPSRQASSPGGLASKAETLPSGEMWLHEIKHDGFRLIAQTVSGCGSTVGPAMT
jgi:ATP-dependent DNA ligase